MADPIKLAYFMAVKEGASYLGGLLVTVHQHNLQPGQSILYGKSLEPHLKEEVIQKTLLKELKTPPDLFILSATELAGGWSGDVKYPVLAVQKSQESPLSKVGDTFRSGPRELLIQLAEGAAPLRVMFAAAVEPAVG